MQSINSKSYLWTGFSALEWKQGTEEKRSRAGSPQGSIRIVGAARESHLKVVSYQVNVLYMII